MLLLELIKSTGFFTDVVKALAVIIARIYFNKYISHLGDTLKLIINLITFGIPLYYTFAWFKAYLRYKEKQNYVNELINGCLNNHFGGTQDYNHKNEQKQTNTPIQQEQPYQQQTIITSEQIEQLKQLRSSVSIEAVKHFPVIRVSGKNMPNLIPGAGIFTAKIKRFGELMNLVVMLASLNAVSEFEKLCISYASITKDFWAEGYLLPSRSGICYSVLLVTSFRFCGKYIVF